MESGKFIHIGGMIDKVNIFGTITRYDVEMYVHYGLPRGRTIVLQDIEPVAP